MDCFWYVNKFNTFFCSCAGCVQADKPIWWQLKDRFAIFKSILGVYTVQRSRFCLCHSSRACWPINREPLSLRLNYTAVKKAPNCAGFTQPRCHSGIRGMASNATVSAFRVILSHYAGSPTVALCLRSLPLRRRSSKSLQVVYRGPSAQTHLIQMNGWEELDGIQSFKSAVMK